MRRHELPRISVGVDTSGECSVASSGAGSTSGRWPVCANNGLGGVFLDLQPNNGPLAITGFDTPVDGAAGVNVSVEVWVRSGGEPLEIETVYATATVRGTEFNLAMEPGDLATPQRPAYTLALTSPKWVRAYVTETELGHIRPDQAARVSTDSHPDQPITGRVGYISSVAEFTPKSVQTEALRPGLVYEVRILLDDPEDRLRLGMPATVRIPLGTPPAAR